MPRTIGEPPNVENTVPLDLFQAQSPARYSHMDGDKAVLYAGAPNAFIHVSPDTHPLSALAAPVSIYVLNTSLVLWSQTLHTGADIAYTSVVLHALKEQDGKEVLYLQIMSPKQEMTRRNGSEEEKFSDVARASEVSEIELVIGLGHSPQEVPPLLSHAASVPELYHALSTCSAFHYDSDSGSDDGWFSADPEPNQWFTADNLPAESVAVPASWLVSGDADDLGSDMHESDSQDEAGMNIALHYRPAAGVSRKSNSLNEKDKKRRIQ